MAGAQAWIQRVGDAERRGELLSAFDLAEQGLEEHPGDLWLRHRAVLVLARAGSTAEALRRFDAYGLSSVDDADVRALRARIAKDVALASNGGGRRREASRAASMYREIFDATGGYYPGINAATLLLIAGDHTGSRELATLILGTLGREDVDSYFVSATEAEAALLLGRRDRARVALARAARLHHGDHGSVATTRRQLRLVCQTLGLDTDVLSELAGPSVVYFCGHRIASDGTASRFPAAQEASVAARIAEAVDNDPPGFAYGSLASGADILFAEALLHVGAELHVVLPFAEREFVRSSVAGAGPAWVDRFAHCLRAASSVTFATNDAYLEDDILFRYGSELAMGLALLRARFLDARVRQLAVWDGRPTGGAGTAIDVSTWAKHHHEAEIIPPSNEPPSIEPTGGDAPRTAARVVRSLLFADVKGFSKLTDEQLPPFAEHVLGLMARVLDERGEAVAYRNTWGDALYAVFEDVLSAAACALELQEAMGSIDFGRYGLPEHLALRSGVHVGPVFSIRDPVLGVPAFMGSHVSRTARIEPVTPPGAVFTTEAFAAALELENSRFGFDYVGHIPAAKDYGRLRMYRLRPA